MEIGKVVEQESTNSKTTMLYHMGDVASPKGEILKLSTLSQKRQQITKQLQK